MQAVPPRALGARPGHGSHTNNAELPVRAPGVDQFDHIPRSPPLEPSGLDGKRRTFLDRTNIDEADEPD